MGPQDSQLNNQLQIEMIGNVFYNMLNSVGRRERDERLIQLSADVKEMIQTRSYESIIGGKAPHFKQGVLNLLKVADLDRDDRAELIRRGFGDMLQNPAHHAKGASNQHGNYDMEIEKADERKASTISINVVCFQTSQTVEESLIPRRFYIQMRFFTFPEV